MGRRRKEETSQLAPRLRGIPGQTKSHRGFRDEYFISLLYSPKPRNRVRILIYRNWAILVFVLKLTDANMKMACWMALYRYRLLSSYKPLSPVPLFSVIVGQTV